MANRPLKSIKFPGLPDTYTIPETTVDAVPTQGSNNAVSSGGMYNYLDEISAIDAKTINHTSMGKLLAYINWGRAVIAADSYTRVAYFRCQVNTEYTINKILSEKFRVGYTTDLPADNVSVYNIREDVSATTMTYTTGADATYVVIYYYDSHVDTLDETDIFNSFVITYDEELTAVDKTARTAIADVLPENIKQALLACFQQVAWINEHGQDYYDVLEDALYASSAHHTITNTLTHCTTSNNAVSIGDNKSYSTTLTPDTDYAITYVQVTMGSTDITSTAYNSTTNEINIAHVTDDITIVGFGYSLWHMDTNDAHSLILLKQGGLNKTGNYVYANSGNTIDRTSVVTRVKSSPQPLGICNSSGTPTGAISDFYLIPVPSTATGVNTTILSSGNVILLQCYTANADGTYTALGTLDYQTSTPGRASYTFTEAILNALQGDAPVVLFYLSKYADGKWYSDDPSYRPTRATIDFVSV